MKKECVRREIVKQSHFVEKVLSFIVTIDQGTQVCRVIHYLGWITIV